MAQVKFITSGANSAFGGFSVGDLLRCSDAMANHLVNEIKCAEFVAQKQATEEKKVERKPKK